MLKISNTENGVKAFLHGFTQEDLSHKIQECQEGVCSCNCDTEIMQKTKKIEVQSQEQGASIEIIG